MNPNDDATVLSSRTYRTAMALNNMGVSMMTEQGGGAFHHAIRIFKESFDVMSSQHYIPSGGEFGDVFLADISQEREREQQEPSMMMANHVSVSLHPLLEICPCDDGDMFFQRSTLACVSKFVPIHLRSQDFYDQQQQGGRGGYSSQHNENANLALAIIMYNHGLAHLLAHLQDNICTSSSMPGGCVAGSSSTQHGHKLLHGAVVALNCSHVMMDRYLDAIDNAGRHKFEKLGGLVISAMTLKTMMWMSRLDKQDEEAEQAGAMLSHVLAEIDCYQDKLGKLNVNIMCQHPTSTAA